VVGPAHKRCWFQDWFRGTCADDDHDVCSETIKPPEETSRGDPLAERIHSPQRECERAPAARHEAASTTPLIQPSASFGAEAVHRHTEAKRPTPVTGSHTHQVASQKIDSASQPTAGHAAAKRGRMPVTWIPSISESDCSYASNTCSPAPLYTRHTHNCMTPH